MGSWSAIGGARAERRNISDLTATAAKNGRKFTSRRSSTAACRWTRRRCGETTFKGRKLGRWCHLTGVEIFEELRSLVGDIDGLIAMAEEPEWVEDIATTFTNVVLRNLDACMATGIQPDGLWIYGDMAYNHATMCSPRMYRDICWPAHKRLADWAHAHGMKFIYHTDGDVNRVLDLYIEAGFDASSPSNARRAWTSGNCCPNMGTGSAFSATST